MSKNLKNYAAVRTALDKLSVQLKDEAKLDPRFKRGAGRISRLISLLKVAEGKYEIVHSRRVPAKVAKKAAKAASKDKKAKSGGTKKTQDTANVTRLRAVA